MNATQALNQVGGPTEAQVLAARKSPQAILPTNDSLLEVSASYGVKWEVNGVPQTILPHMPQDYVWH